jgi:hypothetical protein
MIEARQGEGEIMFGSKQDIEGELALTIAGYAGGLATEAREAGHEIAAYLIEIAVVQLLRDAKNSSIQGRGPADTRVAQRAAVDTA